MIINSFLAVSLKKNKYIHFLMEQITSSTQKTVFTISDPMQSINIANIKDNATIEVRKKETNKHTVTVFPKLTAKQYAAIFCGLNPQKTILSHGSDETLLNFEFFFALDGNLDFNDDYEYEVEILRTGTPAEMTINENVSFYYSTKPISVKKNIFKTLEQKQDVLVSPYLALYFDPINFSELIAKFTLKSGNTQKEVELTKNVDQLQRDTNKLLQGSYSANGVLTNGIFNGLFVTVAQLSKITLDDAQTLEHYYSIQFS